MRKVVYPYEYIDGCENFNKISLPEKKGFSSHLNMEDITDADYLHAKRVCKDFEIKKIRGLYWFICSICVGLYMSLIMFIFCLHQDSCRFKEDQSKIRSFKWYLHVINGRKMYQSRTMSFSLLICKS